MLLTDLPRHLFDELCDVNLGIQEVMNPKDVLQEVILVAPLAKWFGEGFLHYQNLGQLKVALYTPNGGELFSISVSKDGSSILAAIGGGSHFLNLSSPASQAAAKMLEMATRMLHESHFGISEEGRKVFQVFFGDT